MRKTTLIVAALFAATASVGTAATAGTVEVKFIEPAKYADIGRSSFNQKQHLDTLRAHFESLGKKLPGAQKLAIEITDVDLAGEERWIRNDPDVRVLRGRADWPRITLRYTLSDGARTLQQGEATIADMNYLQSSLGMLKDQALAYERRMISRWFSEKIVAAAH